MAAIWVIFLLFSSMVEGVFGQAAKAPAPVVDVEAGSTSITVQWKPPSTPSTITGYRIQYLPAGGKKKQQNVGPDARQYVLSGLKPETKFKIRMMAITAERGNGRPSGWKSVTTLADAPAPPVVTIPPPTEAPTLPNSPQNLVADAQAHSARVTWDEPRDNGVPVLGYIIAYGPRSNPEENILSVDVHPRVTELTGLTDNVQYRLTMTAFNTEGTGIPAVLDFFTIAEEIVKGPPPQVENLQYTSLSPESIRITWSLPETTDLNVIQSITLGYGDIGASFKRLRTENLEMDATSYDIEGLAPNSRYTVMVMTENKYGDNGPVEIIIETGEIPATTRAPSRANTRAPGGEAAGPPPQIQDVQYTSISSSTVEISWTLPNTSPSNEIEDISIGFGAYGIPPQFLPVFDLESTAVRYVADNLTPGSRYSAMVIARNRFGESDPVVITVELPNESGTDESSESSYQHRVNLGNREEEEEEEVFYLQVPTDVRAEVLTATAVRLHFVDPTLKNQSQVEVKDRYYTVRYKTDNVANYQYMHFRRTNDIVPHLFPENNYEFAVKVVKGVNGHSLYSLPISVFTRDPGHASQSQDVTVVQMRVINAERVLAIINWIPPQNQPQEITGYVLEYTSEAPTPNTNWTKVNVNSALPSATIETLRTGTSYYLRVAHLMGQQRGDYSNPPDVFTTPAFQLGQPYDECLDGEPTEEMIIQRVNWMRSGPVDEPRTALLGVPLPFCDDYYARHECHGLVCFCVPGTSSASSSACPIPGTGTRGVQGDQPFVEGPPCRLEYEAAMREINEARTAGKALNDVHLPYCTDDGYFQPKQCLGSMCYCSTRDGKHTGKEVPLWEAQTLDC